MRQWKAKPNHLPLVIMGIRQCGKTFIAQQFANDNYKHVVYINFLKQEERKDAFYGSKDVDTIILNLSAQIRGSKFVPGETCIIFDEIQDCPEARTSLKFFKGDGRYDIIATGSLLGVKADTDPTPDGLFSINALRCVGACGLAPVMVVNGKVYGKMTPAKAVAVVNEIKAKEAGKEA